MVPHIPNHPVDDAARLVVVRRANRKGELGRAAAVGSKSLEDASRELLGGRPLRLGANFPIGGGDHVEIGRLHLEGLAGGHDLDQPPALATGAAGGFHCKTDLAIHRGVTLQAVKHHPRARGQGVAAFIIRVVGIGDALI